MSIKLTGDKKLKRIFGKDTKTIIRTKVSKIADIILKSVKQAAPKKKRSLEKSLHKKKLGDLGQGIYEGVEHGLWVREGAPPHPIFPREAKALSWPGLPHPVAHVLKHPGQKANPYHVKGVNDALPDVRDELGDLGDVVVK